MNQWCLSEAYGINDEHGHTPKLIMKTNWKNGLEHEFSTLLIHGFLNFLPGPVLIMAWTREDLLDREQYSDLARNALGSSNEER